MERIQLTGGLGVGVDAICKDLGAVGCDCEDVAVEVMLLEVEQAAVSSLAEWVVVALAEHKHDSRHHPRIVEVVASETDCEAVHGSAFVKFRMTAAQGIHRSICEASSIVHCDHESKLIMKAMQVQAKPGLCDE